MQAKLLIVFLIFIMATSCKKYSVIGKWRRLDTSLDSVNNKSQIGDLTISSDSTFILNGGGKLDTPNTPGWYYGGDMSGTWSMPDKNHIIFQIGSEPDKIGLVYKIIDLDKTNMIIVSTLDIKVKDPGFIKYIRL